MKKIILITLIIAAFYNSAKCQLDEKIRYEGVIVGSVIIKGKEIEGYIKRKGTTYSFVDEKRIPAPWEFQGDIKFIHKDVFENKDKIKNKDYNKYGAKDIDGYKYNGDSLVFESLKYADMSAVGAAMLPKFKFMRVISKDKISLYHHHQTPPSIGESSEMDRLAKEYAIPELVYKVGDSGKPRLVNNLNVEKELSDCPEVVQKHKDNKYGIGNEDENGEKSGISNFANKVLLRESVRLEVIQDYNATCN